MGRLFWGAPRVYLKPSVFSGCWSLGKGRHQSAFPSGGLILRPVVGDNTSSCPFTSCAVRVGFMQLKAFTLVLMAGCPLKKLRDPSHCVVPPCATRWRALAGLATPRRTGSPKPYLCPAAGGWGEPPGWMGTLGQSFSAPMVVDPPLCQPARVCCNI